MLNDTNITENADDSLMDCVMLEGNDNSELDTVMSVDGDKEKKAKFEIDWDNAETLILLKDGRREEKGDFAIELTAMVEAGPNTGFTANVKRKIDGKTRCCFFTVDCASGKANRFMGQLNSSFGSGGMTLALNDAQFGSFIHFIKESFRCNKGAVVKKAACVIGLQPCGNYWVFGENAQFDKNGDFVDPTQSPYVWLRRESLGTVVSVPSKDIVPNISTKAGSVDSFKQLVSLLKRILKHNFFSGLTVLAGTVMAVHYKCVLENFSGCPSIIACGPSQTGKSTAVTASLAIIGTTTRYTKGSNAFLLERASLSSVPFAIDDPPKGNKIINLGDLIINLFHGCSNANLKCGTLTPISIAIVATNFDIEEIERVVTRAVVVNFKKPIVGHEDDEEEDLYGTLSTLIKSGEVTRALGWVIKMGKSLSESMDHVKSYRKLIKGVTSGRTKLNWSLIIFFAEKIISLINEDQDDEISFDEYVDFVKKNLRDQNITCCQKDDFSTTLKSSSIVSKSSITSSSIIQQTVTDIIQFAKAKPLKEVLVWLRTGVNVQGREVVAVVLEDVEALSNSASSIKYIIKNQDWGISSTTKDFLKPGSHESSIIVRGKIARKRRCSAIWLNKLEQKDRDLLLKVTTTESQLDDPMPDVKDSEDDELCSKIQATEDEIITDVMMNRKRSRNFSKSSVDDIQEDMINDNENYSDNENSANSSSNEKRNPTSDSEDVTVSHRSNSQEVTTIQTCTRRPYTRSQGPTKQFSKRIEKGVHIWD